MNNINLKKLFYKYNVELKINVFKKIKFENVLTIKKLLTSR